MAIHVATWNTYNALSDPVRMPKAVEHILAINPDVAVFPEGYDMAMLGRHDAFTQATDALLDVGYQVTATPYDDPFHYEFQHGFVGISRLGEHEVVRVEQRQHVSFSVTDPQTGVEIDVLGVLGVHLDHLSEHRRTQTAQEIVDEIIDRHAPTVVLGDINSLHPGGFRAAMLRTVFARRLAGLLPADSKAQEHAACLTRMAEGGPVQVFEQAGLRDVDPRRKATIQAHMKLPPRIVQLDHIFVTADFNAEDFRVHGFTGVSDHRAISAHLRVVE